MPATDKQALVSAIARLESRWGSASVKLGTGGLQGTQEPHGSKGTQELHGSQGTQASQGSQSPQPMVSGALALAPEPATSPMQPAPRAADDVLPTGFARLDELLGVGGLPRGVSASIRGSTSSGKTALALHCLAQAQAQGAIAAFLDLSHSFDPLEAAGRGVDLRWLLILRPADPTEGFALAAALLSGRQVDLLLVDLPARLAVQHENDLRRLSARARRQGSRLIVLEPASLGSSLHGAVAETVSLRLELEQRGWLRAGRDVVGRCVAVTVAKNRFGPPGRQAELEIHYPADGEHFSALQRYALPADQPI